MSMHSTKELLTIIKRNINIEDKKREKGIISIPAGHHGAVMKRVAFLSNDDQRMLTSIKEMIRKNGKNNL